MLVNAAPRFAYAVRDCAQRFARVRFSFLTWETERIVTDSPAQSSFHCSAGGKIQSSERGTVTKDRKQLLDTIPSNFPHRHAASVQCSGNAVAMNSTRLVNGKGSFLTVRYSGVWKELDAKHTSF